MTEAPWQTGCSERILQMKFTLPEWQRRNRKSNKGLGRQSRYLQVSELLTTARHLVDYTELLDACTVTGELATIYTIILPRKSFLLLLPMSLPPLQPKCHLDPQQYWVRNPICYKYCQWMPGLVKCGWRNSQGQIIKARISRWWV